MGLIGASLAQVMNGHALWGLVFPFYPGFLLTLRRDLTEIVAAFFLITGLLLLHRQRSIPAAVCFGLAVFTRETTLLALGGIILVSFVESILHPRREPMRWLVFATPVLAWGIFEITLDRIWGRPPFLAGTGNFGFPLRAFLAYLSAQFRHPSPDNVVPFELLYLVFFAAIALRAAFHVRGMKAEKLAWALFLLMAISLNSNVWVEDLSFLRVLSEFYLFGWILLLKSRSRTALLLLAPTVALWLTLLSARIIDEPVQDRPSVQGSAGRVVCGYCDHGL